MRAISKVNDFTGNRTEWRQLKFTFEASMANLDMDDSMRAVVQAGYSDLSLSMLTPPQTLMSKKLYIFLTQVLTPGMPETILCSVPRNDGL